jgi:hypothetical protein
MQLMNLMKVQLHVESWFLDGNFISFLGVFFQCTGAHWEDLGF